MPRKKKPWRYTAGERGNRVAVFEMEPSGVIQARAWNPKAKGYVRISLKHRDRQKAIEWANAEAKAIRQGRRQLATRITLAKVFALYERHRTQQKCLTEQKTDNRKIELWTRVLGGKSDTHKITLRDWEGFIRDRKSGAIDARGNRVPEGKRKPVGDRAVECDCKWLKWVLNWGTRWQEDGEYLLRENCVRGFEAPQEKNPRRPLASTDRYEKVRQHTDAVLMSARQADRKRIHARSYLSEVLDMSFETGRRLSALLGLRYNDVDLTATDEHGEKLPYGAIRWRGETDKTDTESVVPLGPIARAAIDRILKERPGIGDAPMFPSRDDLMKPISRHTADAWLRRAEALAGLDPQDGSLWHAYRRGWATARKSLPNQIDVAAAGGWSSTRTMEKCYQQATASDMLEAVTAAVALREKKA